MIFQEVRRFQCSIKWTSSPHKTDVNDLQNIENLNTRNWMKLNDSENVNMQLQNTYNVEYVYIAEIEGN